MRDEATAVDIRPRAHRPHVRLLHGMRRPANWLQLVRFGLVGGVGFAVNLIVYAVFVHPLGVEYHVAAAVAWLVAVLNNFVLNRHWTFDAKGGRAHSAGGPLLRRQPGRIRLQPAAADAARGERRRRARCPPRRSRWRPRCR